MTEISEGARKYAGELKAALKEAGLPLSDEGVGALVGVVCSTSCADNCIECKTSCKDGCMSNTSAK